MIFIGCDPGISGAIAVIDETGEFLYVDDMPAMHEGKLAWVDIETVTSGLMDVLAGRPATAYVERAQPMPKQGVSSVFGYGVAFGSLLASIQMLRCRVELVTPAVWKKAQGLTSNKADSLSKARLLFPAAPLDRKKDHGRAEALLIADYGRRR